jgi:hypothetical protein
MSEIQTFPDVRAAYASAVQGYKPWHQHGAWNSSGNDAFWQLIDGGLKNEIFTLEQACTMFNQPARVIEAWAARAIPDRKTRIKVWKELKKLVCAPNA